MNQKPKFDAYVLAGGKSSRMGYDKGLVQVKGRHLISYVIQNLKNCVDQIYICTGNDEYAKFGYQLIPDLIPDAGPSGAIASALRHSKHNKLFIISCDTPFVDQNLIFRIISLSGESDIAIPLLNNSMEPLCGVYSKSCAHEWERLLNQNVRKMQTFIEHFNFKCLNAIVDLEADELSFMNINTPDTLALAEKEGRWR